MLFYDWWIFSCWLLERGENAERLLTDPHLAGSGRARCRQQRGRAAGLPFPQA